MKFNMNRRFALLSLAALLALGGCSEWTDMESVTIKEPQVEKSEAYMQAIRDYKASEHKVLIGWFDNVALPGDRSQHLTVLPDSSANKVKTRKKKEKKEEPKRRRPQQRSFLDEPVTSESE